MRYRGSVSVLWRAVTAAVAAMCACSIVDAASSGADALTLALCAVPAAVAVLMAWTMIANYVELSDDALRVCLGPFRLRVPYGDVTSVHEYRLEGAVIALALGRNRVTIGRRGRASVVVSPDDVGSFMDELQRRVDRQ